MADVHGVLRTRYGRLVAALVRALGPEQVELAEECVQEACAAAVQSWPLRGVPADPTAWLLTVARNRARDVLRRHRRWDVRVAEVAWLEDARRPTGGAEPDELADDELAMLFGCAHPALPVAARVTLALKIVGGLTTESIAAVLMEPPATTAQRLVRAKRILREQPDAVRIPAGAEAGPRTTDVRDVLYLQFTVGLGALGGDDGATAWMEEAIRLGRELVRHPVGARSDVRALLALMLLVSARTPLDDGRRIPLAEQDRAGWDHARIAEGLSQLAAAAGGPLVTALHLEAGIAACHATAPSWEDTDWDRIRDLYALLRTVDDSPVVRLAEQVAVGIDDPAAALAGLAAITGAPEAAWHAANAMVLERAGRDAADAWLRAAACATNPAEAASYRERVTPRAAQATAVTENGPFGKS